MVVVLINDNDDDRLILNEMHLHYSLIATSYFVYLSFAFVTFVATPSTNPSPHATAYHLKLCEIVVVIRFVVWPELIASLSVTTITPSSGVDSGKDGWVGCVLHARHATQVAVVVAVCNRSATHYRSGP